MPRSLGGQQPLEERAVALECDAEARATGGDTGARDTGAAGDTAGAGTATAAAGTSDVATRADPGADSRDTQRDSATNGDAAPLLSDAGGFQTRWEEIQVRFVDEPRGAVEDADALVATVMQRLAEGFAQERERLEAQWGRGEDISTEDLRVALQRYRSFFQRLLST